MIHALYLWEPKLIMKPNYLSSNIEAEIAE